MLPFLLSGGLSLGASFLASLFGPGQKPITQSFRNQQETWNVPASQYGTEIPTLYGTYRVQGTYVAAQIPPDYETDVYFDPVRREEIQTLIYYGNLGVLWGRIPKTDSGINVTANPDVEKIWGNKILLYQNGQIDSIFGEYWGRFEGLSVNNYFHDNNPDAYLAFMGANQIAYWGRCYSVLHRLRLNNSDGKLFNGNYPGLEAEISTGVTSLGMMIRHICWQHGLNVTTGANSEVNTSELDSVEIKGYATKSGSLGEKLLAAQIAYNFWPIDVGNQLKFIKQYRAGVSAYIGLENLAAHESGGKAQELFICEETPVSELPTQVRVRFRDINLSYQENSRVSFEINLENRQNIEDLDLTQLVLTETEALNIANRHLQLRWLRRFTYRLSVLGNYAYLEAGDVITVGFSTGSQNLQITRINTAANGLISIEAYPYDAQVFGYSYLAPAPQSASASITQGTPIFVGQTNIYAVNSVTNQAGTVTYIEGVDYTVNLTNGTVTPIIGGGIPNGSTIIINYQGQATPQTPVAPPVIPPPAVNSYPKIFSFSPTQGAIGDEITIYGENFTGATSASINGVAIGSFVVVSDGVITGVVGNATTTGKVSVTSPSGTGQSLTDFVIVTGGVDWGDIGGTLSDQTDLQNALDSKMAIADYDSDDDGVVDSAEKVEGINTAGNSKYYGTNGLGVAGFYDLPPQNTYGSFFAASPTVKNIPLFTATRATTINELRGVKTASGTATVSIQVGGVNVTGLTNLSITSSPQNFTATGGNTVSVGTRVTVNVTAVSSATDLEFTMGATLN